MKRLFILFGLISSFLLIATPVFAQPTKLTSDNCLVGGADKVATLACVPIIVGNVIFWLLVGAGILALVLIIISGFKFVFSGGDPKQTEGARKTLTWAIVGLLVILLSFAIINFIAKTTGVGCITKFGFTQCVPEDVNQPCSETSPNGFCEGGKTCLRNKGFRGFSCQFRCNKDHHGGWCPVGTTCKRIADEWNCRP